MIKMNVIFRILLSLSLSLSLIVIEVDSIPEWKNHNISTLKLLQIVHRHGERTPLEPSFASTDPFRNESKYWVEGLGQLTTKGKYRMYKIGEFIRKNYDSYLGQNHSPREVYVRSSLEHRCIESASCLLAGAYPPKNNWKWSKIPDGISDGEIELGNLWQPFPIETFMPKSEDDMLVPDKKCPKADLDIKNVINSADVKHFLKNYQSENMTFIKKLFNESIETLRRGEQLWDTLNIELDHDYIWGNLTLDRQKDIVLILQEFNRRTFIYNWSTDLIKRVRVGKLIETIATNMKNIVHNSKTDNYKLFVYSTHDSIVAPLLQAFKIFDGSTPTFGSALIFELHQNTTKEYFIKIYYFNETLTREPYFMASESFDTFYDSAKKNWFYDNFDELCGTNSKKENVILAQMTFMVIGIGIGISVLGLVCVGFMCLKKKRISKKYSLDRQAN